jgi:hypothetical protein
MRLLIRSIWILLFFTIIFSGCKNGSDKGCDFDQYLNDPKTPALAKAIVNGNEWNLNDFTVVAFLDSLTAVRRDVRPFYFRVVTNSLQKADGYYAETLGMAGKDFVEFNTKEFASHFDNKDCFTDKDLNDWVHIVMLEFGILAENESDSVLMKEYVGSVRQNCKSCSASQKATIERFLAMLDIEWQETLSLLKKDEVPGE